MQHSNVIGWDIGGAHLKVAQADNADTITQIIQVACPLWLGMEELQKSLEHVKENMDFASAEHAITMTGELVDYFESRKKGVVCIVQKLSNFLNSDSVSYYAGNNGFISTQQAIHEFESVASANWLASANFIAKRLDKALFIDIGSTTTDILAIQDHQVLNDAYSDSERLYAQELVYCGVVRTPIFALCKSAPVEEKFIPIINEYFSNMADVYRLTKELPKHADIVETPDGRDKDEKCSAVRLARMFGYDAVSEHLSMWRGVAEYVREQQVQIIKNACRKRLFKLKMPSDTPIVGAGVGRFLAEDIAHKFNREYIDFSSLVNFNNSDLEIKIGDCAPAVSVACLGYKV